MTEFISVEEWKRLWQEKYQKHGGSLEIFKEKWQKHGYNKKELLVRENLKLCGTQKIIKIWNDFGTFYTTKLVHDDYTLEFDWEGPPSGTYNITYIIGQCRNDYVENGVRTGIREELVYAIFDEIIKRDLDPSGTLQEDKEYNKRSEQISGETLKQILLEREEEETNQKVETEVIKDAGSKPIDEEGVSISQFRIRSSSVIWGQVKKFGDSIEGITQIYTQCVVCKAKTEYIIDDQSKYIINFNPPITEDKIWDLIVPPYRCDDADGCGRPNTVKPYKQTETLREITLADPNFPETVLDIVVPASLGAFDLNIGDIIKVKGITEYTRNKKVIKRLRVEQLEILKRSAKINKVDIHKVSILPIADQNLDENLNLESRRRNIIFAKYKEIYLTRSTGEEFNKVIQQLLDEKIPEIMTLVTNDIGELSLNVSNNRKLRNLRDSLLETHHGDDGKLIKIGDKPFKLKWKANNNVKALT